MTLRRRLPAALQQRDYALLWVALVVMSFATQMVAGRRRLAGLRDPPDPFDLGLIGLAEFLPLLVLALPAGQLADRVLTPVRVRFSLVIEIACSSRSSSS